MAERLGEALLDLRTDDKGYDTGVRSAERRAERLGKRLDDTARRAVAMGKTMALAAAAGATALGVLVKRAIDNADAMSKSAQRAGVSTEALSRLAWAGELSDVSVGTLTTSLGRLANVMAQSVSGQAKDTLALFNALGIELTDTEGRLRATDEVMADIAEKFAAMPDGAEKSAIAIKLFGRSGADLITLLNNGRDGLAAMGAEADRLGITISTETGKRAEAFNDAMTRVKAAMQGVIVRIAEHLLPELNAFGEKLSDPKFVAAAQAMANGIVSALKDIIPVIRELLGWLGSLAKGWENLSQMPGLWPGHNLFGQPIPDGVSNDTPPLADDDFDGRFDPGLPGKTNRVPAKPKTPPQIDWTDLLNSGGGGGGGVERLSEFEREIELIRERTEARELEARTIGMTTFEAEKLLAVARLEAAAKADGRDLTASLVAEIEREEAIDAEYRLGEAISFRRGLMDGAMSDFRSALDDGKITLDEWASIALNALDRVIDKIQTDLLDAIFEANDTLGKAGGGWSQLLGLFSGIFGGGASDPWGGLRLAGGGWVHGPGGPTDDKVPAMLSDGEHVTRAAMARKYAALLNAINADRLPGFAEGGWAGGRLVPEVGFGIVSDLPSLMPRPQASLPRGQIPAAPTTVRLVMPEGWRAEIVGEARRGAQRDTVQIVEEFDRGLPDRLHAISGDPRAR
ncbi:MAG: hypothetical protein ABJM69_09680 [Nitratireductor sp.]